MKTVSLYKGIAYIIEYVKAKLTFVLLSETGPP